MEIYLVRHGIAEEVSASGSDAHRRLTDEGREKTERVARAFRKRVDHVDLIFHSPYARAEETARIFADEFPKAKLSVASGLTPHDPAKSALPLLAFDGQTAIMIVGHEPHLSSLASLLLTGKDQPVVEFRKAGIAGIECHGPLHNCRLQFLLMPKWL